MAFLASTCFDCVTSYPARSACIPAIAGCSVSGTGLPPALFWKAVRSAVWIWVPKSTAMSAMSAVLPIDAILPNEISAFPKILDTNRLGELADGLTRNAVSNLPRLPREPALPTGAVNISSGLSLSKSLEQLAVEQKKLEADLVTEVKDFVATELALDKMIKEAGGICPLCSSTMTLGGIHGH